MQVNHKTIQSRMSNPIIKFSSAFYSLRKHYLICDETQHLQISSAPLENNYLNGIYMQIYILAFNETRS